MHGMCGRPVICCISWVRLIIDWCLGNGSSLSENSLSHPEILLNATLAATVRAGTWFGQINNISVIMPVPSIIK